MLSLYRERSTNALRSICVPLLLFSCAFTAAAQQPKEGASAATQPPPLPGEMTLYVTVTDEKGRYVSGLTKELFTLTDGGTPREITSLSDAPEPSSVGVLFDISNSMRDRQQNAVEDSRRAFARFFKSASPQNEYFLWAFNHTVMELTGWTRSEAELSRGLDRIAPKTMPTKNSGATAIYDACDAALDKMASSSYRKHVLLIFTDGFDTISETSFKTLRRKVRGSETLIYPVVMVERGSPGSPDAAAQTYMDELAEASGGRAFFPEVVAELNEIAERIAIELNTQFAISFVPANAAKKGELSRVKIKLKPPPYFKGTMYVRVREGYISAPE